VEIGERIRTTAAGIHPEGLKRLQQIENCEPALSSLVAPWSFVAFRLQIVASEQGRQPRARYSAVHVARPLRGAERYFEDALLLPSEGRRLRSPGSNRALFPQSPPPSLRVGGLGSRRRRRDAPHLLDDLRRVGEVLERGSAIEEVKSVPLRRAGWRRCRAGTSRSPRPPVRSPMRCGRSPR